MNVMRDAQIWDQNNVHCAHKCADAVRTNVCTNVRTNVCTNVRTNVRMLYLCTVEFQRDDCMTMQMFADALPRLAING